MTCWLGKPQNWNLSNWKSFICICVLGCLRGAGSKGPAQLTSDWLAGAACLANCRGCIRGLHPVMATHTQPAIVGEPCRGLFFFAPLNAHLTGANSRGSLCVHVDMQHIVWVQDIASATYCSGRKRTIPGTLARQANASLVMQRVHLKKDATAARVVIKKSHII